MYPTGAFRRCKPASVDRLTQIGSRRSYRRFEGKDRARAGVTQSTGAVGKMLCEIRVVIEPPHRGARKEDVLRAIRAQGFKMGDRLTRVGGVVTCVRSVFHLREMPAATVASEIEKPIVSV